MARAALAALSLVLASPKAALATTTLWPSADKPGTEILAEAMRAEVLRVLDPRASGGLVVRIRAELPSSARDPHGLAFTLTRPTAETLEALGRFEPVHVALFEGEGEEAAARAARLGYDVLVDLSIRTTGNFVRVEGAVWTTAPPNSSDPLELRSRIDIDLRRYLAPAPRVSARRLVARTYELPASGYLAVRTIDLDRDGRTELVLLERSAVSVLRLSAVEGLVQLVEIARAPLPDLSHSPVPTRRRLATASEHEGAVVIRSSEFAAPVRVEFHEGALRVSRSEGPCDDAAFPIDRGCARLVEGRDFFEETIASFDSDAPAHTAPGRFYTHVGRRIRTAEGDVLDVEAIITQLGRLALRIGPHSVAASGYGTALALADIDDDGAAELLVSGPNTSGDRLSLLRVLPRGALRRVWESEPIEGSIWLADAGDLDGDGALELLAIEEPPSDTRQPARLWVVR